MRRRRIAISVAALIMLSPSVLLAQVDLAQADSSSLRESNSQYFHEYFSLPNIDNRISAIPADAPQSSRRIVVAHSQPQWKPSGGVRVSGRGDYLASLSANSELIIVGEPISRYSAITNDHGFVFSDYVVAVDRVIKNDGQPVLAGMNIVVARAGGEITYRGCSVRGIDPEFHLFQLNRQYVFFLKLLPNNQAYKVTADRSFLFDGGKAVSSRASLTRSIDKDEFLGDLQGAIDLNSRFKGAR